MVAAAKSSGLPQDAGIDVELLQRPTTPDAAPVDDWLRASVICIDLDPAGRLNAGPNPGY